MVHASALTRTSVLALVLALILFADTVQSASPRRGTNSSVLMSKLLETYCQTCPPPEGSQVQVQLALLNIPEVSTDKAFIQVHGWWRMYWNDPALTWDAELWGVKTLHFSADAVWTPDLMMYEHIEEEATKVTVSVTSKGSAHMSVPRTTTLGCTMNLTSYPFDKQFCGMTIGSWSLNGDQLDVVPRAVGAGFWLTRDLQAANASEAPGHSFFDLGYYRAQPDSAEFELKSLRVVTRNKNYSCCAEPYPVVEVEFELHRGTVTIIISLIFPMVWQHARLLPCGRATPCSREATDENTRNRSWSRLWVFSPCGCLRPCLGPVQPWLSL